MFCEKPKSPRFCRCVRKSNEPVVKPGLAVTPHEMELMHSKGIPISSSSLDQQYYDGDTSKSFEIPIDRQRGVDISDVWNASKDAKKRMSKRQKKSVDVNPVKS